MLRERIGPRRGRVHVQPDGVIGPLEQRVLDWLWTRPGPASVRDLQPDFPGTAYTTLMTTLDRLRRKGLLERAKAGRAYQYLPQFSREELASVLAHQSIERLLGSAAGGWQPVLSALVDTVSREDRTVLDELERLIRERRETERTRGGQS